MNKYAEILYGKVQAIYEDERDFATFKNIFSPTAYFVDVTGQECDIGYIATYQAGVGIILAPPPDDNRTAAEKAIAVLDSEYETSKKELSLAYVDAVMSDDAELQDSLKAELAALNETYDSKRTELENETEE